MTESPDGVPLTKIFGERTIYDNPWVRLVQVDIEPPDGRRFWHTQFGCKRWLPPWSSTMKTAC